MVLGLGAMGLLAARWNGDWVTLWRPPPGRLDVIVSALDPPPARAGAAAAPAGAQWLADALARDPEAGGAADLRTRLRAFQRAQGLRPDGLPGPQTLMALRRTVVDDEPKLSGAPVTAAQER